MRASGDPAAAAHAGSWFAFGDFPPGSLHDMGGAFRLIGLAALQPARRRRRGAAARSAGNCLLPGVAHAHVYSAALDLSPMQQESTNLNWPDELQALAREPDNATVITKLQERLSSDLKARPSVSTRLVRSRGLVWRDGGRVPVSGVYERVHTLIPLISYLKTHPEVAAGFGRCLADPEHQQTAFLLTCTAAAGLTEHRTILAGLPPEERADAIDALYGHVRLEPGRAVIIALPLR